jgi:hypothetical protein
MAELVHLASHGVIGEEEKRRRYMETMFEWTYYVEEANVIYVHQLFTMLQSSPLETVAQVIANTLISQTIFFMRRNDRSKVDTEEEDEGQARPKYLTPSYKGER